MSFAVLILRKIYLIVIYDHYDTANNSYYKKACDIQLFCFPHAGGGAHLRIIAGASWLLNGLKYQPFNYQGTKHVYASRWLITGQRW